MDTKDYTTMIVYSMVDENCDRCIQLIHDGEIDISYFELALTLMQINIDKILQAFLIKYPEIIQTDFSAILPLQCVELGNYRVDYRSIIEYTVKHGGSPGSIDRYQQLKYLFTYDEQKQLDTYISLYNPDNKDFNHYCRFVLSHKNENLTVAESIEII